MATDSYSTYDAKSRFSEVLRKVREGRTVTITYHGEPVAEMRPIREQSGTAARLRWLHERGVVTGGSSREGRLEAVSERCGALQRFLDERE